MFTFSATCPAEDGEEEYGLSAKEFVNNDFYVDETVELLQNTQAMLATAQLRLHKAVSNSVFVMEALPEEDRGKSICDLDLQHDSLPTQRSLGVHWDLEGDAFTFKVVLPERPYTRRGVLSVINAPVNVKPQGRGAGHTSGICHLSLSRGWGIIKHLT